MINHEGDHALQIPTLHPVFAERIKIRSQSEYQKLWTILDSVHDPELPGVTIWDLGILQDIKSHADNAFTIVITLTYSGCPAVDAIKQDIIKALSKAGYDQVNVEISLTPAWNTNMISPEGHKQIAALNIAPPVTNDAPDCPVCGSHKTQLLSQFGSTSCKAFYRCEQCSETFDYFKQLE